MDARLSDTTVNGAMKLTKVVDSCYTMSDFLLNNTTLEAATESSSSSPLL